MWSHTPSLLSSYMTNIKSLLLNRREKTSLLYFSRWKIGCMKMERMKPKACILPSSRSSRRLLASFAWLGASPPPPPNQNCTFDLGFENMQRGDPIEERYKDHSERGAVINQLAYCINSYREAVMSNDPKFDHIDVAEKQKVMTLSSRVLQLMLTRLISF